MCSLESPISTVPEAQQCESCEICQHFARLIYAWTWTHTITFYTVISCFNLLAFVLAEILYIFLGPYVRRVVNYLYGLSSNRTDTTAREYSRIVPAPVDRPHKLRVIQAKGQNKQSSQKRSKDDVDATFYLYTDDFKRGWARNEITFNAVLYVEDKESGVKECV